MHNFGHNYILVKPSILLDISFFNWAIPGLIFFIFGFSMQLIENKICHQWLWLCRKRPLYQLSHNQ